jgi:hypothetical protein
MRWGSPMTPSGAKEGDIGTNYYAHKDGEEPLHIGKASARWRFMFHGPPGGPKSFAEWKALLAEGWTINDSPAGWGADEVLTLEEFVAMVEERKDGRTTEGDFRPDWVDEEGNPFLRGEFS